MMNFAAISDKIVAAYNAKDFEILKSLIAPNLDFAHFNRDIAFKDRDSLFEVIYQFANVLAPDRRIEKPERVTEMGNIVVREAYYTATAQADIHGFAAAGQKINLNFCTVLRFDDEGLVVEWKDYG